MLSDKRFTYYQPEHYSDDGTNIDYGGLPEGLFSFEAFPTRKECEEWLQNNGYNAADFVIHEYHDDDIEDVELIDAQGDTLCDIDELSLHSLNIIIASEVIKLAGGMKKLRTPRLKGESFNDYMSRVRALALYKVNAAIVSIEESGEYNFQYYINPEGLDWYTEAKDMAIDDVVNWMTK